MPDLTVNRTLVKSPPELWSELSEVESLARHLGEFGEIAISRLEPEHTVAWEGEHARGTVQLEASGWGTKVTLSAQLPGAAPAADAPASGESAEVVDPPESAEPAEPPAPGPAPARRGSWLRRWLLRRRVDAEPVAIVPQTPTREIESVEVEPLAWYEPDPGGPEEEPGVNRERAQCVLEEALENLGSAHHRPFSREG